MTGTMRLAAFAAGLMMCAHHADATPRLLALPGNAGLTDQEYLQYFDGELLFSGQDAVAGTELWRFDDNGFALIDEQTTGPANPTHFQHRHVSGSNIYFRRGAEVLSYDGTNINTIHALGDANNFVDYNNETYFTSANSLGDQSLWKTSGGTATEVYDFGRGRLNNGSIAYYDGLIYMEIGSSSPGAGNFGIATIDPDNPTNPSISTGNGFTTPAIIDDFFFSIRTNGTNQSVFRTLFQNNHSCCSEITTSSAFPGYNRFINIVPFLNGFITLGRDSADNDYDLFFLDTGGGGGVVGTAPNVRQGTPLEHAIINDIFYFISDADGTLWSFDGTTATQETTTVTGINALTASDDALFFFGFDSTESQWGLYELGVETFTSQIESDIPLPASFGLLLTGLALARRR